MDTTQYQVHEGGGFIGIIALLFMMVIYLGFILVIAAGAWKTFVKMGHPGWAGIVPYYNLYLIVEAIGKPISWFILVLIPCTAIIFVFLVAIEFAKRFGKGAGFGVGLVLLPFIFFPILGFGNAKYLGPLPKAAA